ncbi:MAG: hypothetical protein KatS3mg122_3322 [Caldimonas sp.]|nr:MAG: hypothetical protein KatS3mg122_3322 [Caldimonas sp.]
MIKIRTERGYGLDTRLGPGTNVGTRYPVRQLTVSFQSRQRIALATGSDRDEFVEAEAGERIAIDEISQRDNPLRLRRYFDWPVCSLNDSGRPCLRRRRRRTCLLGCPTANDCAEAKRPRADQEAPAGDHALGQLDPRDRAEVV